jgi:3'-phosphoadenosine 5'-phosphosulfate sulfotransferase (PAPS reductase)/FAD synthetase
MSSSTPPPALRVLSLGAGVQSTTLLLLSAHGRLPALDAAVFADTGWEPAAVYAHLDRLEREVAAPAGIPVLRVSAGNIRDDALDPTKRFASMPLFVRGPGGSNGMIRRQCTGSYKITPIKRQIRALLGYPHPTRVPRGVFAEQWIGISTDELHRAKDADVAYMRNRFPLLDVGWSRDQCRRYLSEHGFAGTPKSACLGCPYHGNAQWRALRDHSPAEWMDVVAFDHAIRAGNARGNQGGNRLLGEAFLHRSRLPLDQAPIDHVTAREWAEQQATLDEAAAEELENGADEGCSPWSCRSGSPAGGGYGLTA